MQFKLKTESEGSYLYEKSEAGAEEKCNFFKLIFLLQERLNLIFTASLPRAFQSLLEGREG